MRSIAMVLLVATGPVIGARVAGAQTTRPCPPATSEPFAVCQVDRAPRSRPDNAAPRYPVMMFEAGASGVVRVAFVVDTAGRVEPASFTVIDSANASFITTTEAAVRTWTFEPGMRGGRPVTVRWEQIVAFSIPRDSELPRIETVVLTRDVAPGGVPRIVVGVPARQPDAILLFTNRELLEAQRQTLALLMPEGLTDSAGKPRVTVCLTINRGGQPFAADAETLAGLEGSGRRAVIPRDCPPTYEMLMYDTRRAPPGNIDPYIIDVVHVSAWNADVVRMQIDVSHRLADVTYRCWATRVLGAWRPNCRRSSISDG